MEYSVLIRPESIKDHEKSLSLDTRKANKLKVPADIKLALYRQRNYRKRLLREKGSEIKVRSQTRNSKSTAGTQLGTNPIVATLPQSLQGKGEQFLSFLQQIPNFKVNDRGEVSYGAEEADGSRIIDIVHDFVRERPAKSPAKGWKLVAAALKEANVPREFIGNRSRWQYIQSLESSSASTPRTRPSIAKTLSDIGSLRRRLQFQSGSGVGRALKTLKWRRH